MKRILAIILATAYGNANGRGYGWSGANGRPASQHTSLTTNPVTVTLWDSTGALAIVPPVYTPGTTYVVKLASTANFKGFIASAIAGSSTTFPTNTQLTQATAVGPMTAFAGSKVHAIDGFASGATQSSSLSATKTISLTWIPPLSGA